MKSRQFPTFEAAIAFLEERGKLEFFGREGHNCDIFIYNFTCEGRLFHLWIYENGKVEVKE